MFHTFVPPRDFFAPCEEQYHHYRNKNTWICVRTDKRGACVERLISTNPYDYLSPRCQPGNSIKISNKPHIPLP